MATRKQINIEKKDKKKRIKRFDNHMILYIMEIAGIFWYILIMRKIEKTWLWPLIRILGVFPQYMEIYIMRGV